MSRHETTGQRLAREMDELVAQGMTLEQASRAIAERQTKLYFDGLAAQRERKNSKRYR